MGLVVDMLAHKGGRKEYVAVLERPKVTPKEVPIILVGKPYLKDDLLDLIRTAFRPYSDEAKRATVDAFEGAVPTYSLFMQRFVTEQGESYCPIGYAAMIDGFGEVVAPTCTWATASCAWTSKLGIGPSSHEWNEAKEATTRFVKGWDDNQITVEHLREALL